MMEDAWNFSARFSQPDLRNLDNSVHAEYMHHRVCLLEIDEHNLRKIAHSGLKMNTIIVVWTLAHTIPENTFGVCIQVRRLSISMGL